MYCTAAPESAAPARSSACHLIEQGLSPEAALGRLNELWQGSDRSDTWPEVPETDEQREFICAALGVLECGSRRSSLEVARCRAHACVTDSRVR